MPPNFQAPKQEEKRLMTIKEAAEYLSVPVPTLYRRVWERSIPFVKLGRSVRFDRRDLEALIDASKVKPRTGAGLFPDCGEDEG